MALRWLTTFFFLIKVLIVQSTRHGVFEQNSRIEMISEISMTWNKAWINPCLFDQFITSGVPFLLCSVKWADMRAVAWKNIIGAFYVNIDSFALMVSLWILNFRIIHLIWSFKLRWTSNLKVLTGSIFVSAFSLTFSQPRYLQFVTEYKEQSLACFANELLINAIE